MKLFILSLIFFTFSISGRAQIQVHITVSTSFNDILSKSFYDDIVSSNRKLDGYAATKTATIERTKDIYIEPNKELTRINSSLTSQKNDLLNFAYNRSYKYIQDKYPIVPSTIYASSKLSNIIVRRRFSKKLQSEKENITNYLDNTNYIPEGKRLDLIFDSLEKVIRITLEDETY